jgi:hypothetical protein
MLTVRALPAADLQIVSSTPSTPEQEHGEDDAGRELLDRPPEPHAHADEVRRGEDCARSDLENRPAALALAPKLCVVQPEQSVPRADAFPEQPAGSVSDVGLPEPDDERQVLAPTRHLDGSTARADANILDLLVGQGDNLLARGGQQAVNVWSSRL